MGIFANIILGATLTKLTSVHEELIASRAQGFIGEGGGVDSLPVVRRKEIEEKYPKWLQQLRKYPANTVTHALVKNLQVVDMIGNGIRAQAIGELFELLVKQGIAMSAEEMAGKG